ncbi:MAG TPA: class 1 fructose-bisphosphatase [Nitrososphaerales archaeon]|nr:class 1 fructose-bisphosphatase [Nitrososphaerales archaeon]
MKLEEFLRANTTKDVSKLMMAIAESSIKVWEAIPTSTGLLSSVNPSGEEQKAIDLFSNEVFTKALLATGTVRQVASEEMAQPAEGRGSVCVAMDPLDGSSNVGTGNPVGSIFGFYSEPLPAPGRALLGALFVTYGSMTTITLSLGTDVHRFVAVRRGSRFEFELLETGIRIPIEPEVYGFGGSRKDWIEPVQKFVGSLEDRGLKLRYCGTFVGDYNQVLSRGGIFAYPALRSKPNGKLRVLYETAPMAFITEQAGGYSTDGTRSILELSPKSLPETSPAYLGTGSLAREVEELISQSGSS